MANPKVEKILQFVLTHGRENVAGNIQKIREGLENLLPSGDQDTSDLEAQNEAMRSNLDSLNKAANDMEAKLQTQIDELTTQAAADKEQLDACSSQINAKNKEIDALNAHVADLEKELEVAKTSPDGGAPPQEGTIPGGDVVPAGSENVAPTA
jgi:chromosome segregation ATPase